jgi:manganese/zinc/iron transport system permease protein
MSLGVSLIGVFVFLRKSSLVGEALSHAAYPGILLGALFLSQFTFISLDYLPFFVLGGGFCTALLGGYCLRFLKRSQIPEDASLTFVLSSFFGFGVVLASYLQFVKTALYQESLLYLFGQAATMTDRHMVIFGVLSGLILFGIFLFYKEWKIFLFDRAYAASLGVPVDFLETLFFVFLVLSLILGIRSVGVVLVSAMLFCPAAAASQWTSRFSSLLILSSFFGVLSGFLGSVISIYFGNRPPLPLGPMIVLVATFICLFSLFFSPHKGIVFRYIRILNFKKKRILDNLLKTFWKHFYQKKATLNEIVVYEKLPKWFQWFFLEQLVRSRFLKRVDGCYVLTRDGEMRAAHIVRLHRLWELYLVKNIGVQEESVHSSAEEMEHILTPFIEKELTKELNDPKIDPHNSPIPPQGGVL